MPTSDRVLPPALRLSRALLGAALPACVALLACDPGAVSKRPDVCLLLIDTLRADHLGLHGYTRKTSPNLDAFAAESIVFADVVAPSSWTMPSVGSLMTSAYPSVHGLRSRTGDATMRALRPQLATLAEAMRAAGYRTAALVANPWASPAQGLRKGFDEYEVFDIDTKAATLNYVARQVLDRSDPAPVFLYVHYMDVHGPYDGVALVPPEALGPIPPLLARRMTRAERRSVPGYLRLKGAGTLGTYIHAYDAGIHLWDRAFGEWLAWLSASGRADDTIVAVTADHGEEFLDHGSWNHGTNLNQESIWIPWILRVPGRAPQRIADRSVSLIDVAPTLLAAVGAEIPETMAGLDALDGAGGAAARDLFSETEITIGGIPGVPRKAVRRGTRKLIRTPTETRCFDLSFDPAEQLPLLGDAACDGELSAALDAWQRGALERATALGPAPEPTLDAPVREQLRALGYAE